MAMPKLSLKILTAGLCLGSVIGQSALALEDVSRFLPGCTVDVPVGALPPPGLYMSTFAIFFDLQVKNQNGASLGIPIRDSQLVNELTYVPALPQILGATYGAFIVQPVRLLSVGLPNGTASAFGTVNTLISPLNLSWNLQNGLFVSFGLTFYPPGETYNVANAVQVSRNYFTFEPGIGISYLANAWNITLHPVFDINATNPVNGYKSGNVFVMDYSISHKIGAFEIGLGATFRSSSQMMRSTALPLLPFPAPMDSETA
jgi:hypothetical protein